LSLLRADFINTAMAKKKQKLEDADALAVIRKQAKQREDSIEQFTKGNRVDLADKEKHELEILKSYLPQELAEEELNKIIDEAVATTGASGLKDMGKVMKEANTQIAGRADGKLVSELVKKRLGSP
jgi:uncharacterized protein YqeY